MNLERAKREKMRLEDAVQQLTGKKKRVHHERLAKHPHTLTLADVVLLSSDARMGKLTHEEEKTARSAIAAWREFYGFGTKREHRKKTTGSARHSLNSSQKKR